MELDEGETTPPELAEAESRGGPEDRDTLKVIVHYPAAAEPFKDDDADPSERVGHLKQRVLVEFGLSEGATPDGNTVTYELSHGRESLDDPEQALGDVGEGHGTLSLKLSQRIIQG